LFLAETGEMAASLAVFLKSKDKNSIRSFELHRAKLAALTGVGAFWSAILNIRLNSVPVLDPAAAVKESLDVCTRIKTEVLHAVSVII